MKSTEMRLWTILLVHYTCVRFCFESVAQNIICVILSTSNKVDSPVLALRQQGCHFPLPLSPLSWLTTAAVEWEEGKKPTVLCTAERDRKREREREREKFLVTI